MSYIRKCILGVVLHVLFVKIYTKYFHMRMGIFIKKKYGNRDFPICRISIEGVFVICCLKRLLWMFVFFSFHLPELSRP